MFASHRGICGDINKKHTRFISASWSHTPTISMKCLIDHVQQCVEWRSFNKFVNTPKNYVVCHNESYPGHFPASLSCLEPQLSVIWCGLNFISITWKDERCCVHFPRSAIVHVIFSITADMLTDLSKTSSRRQWGTTTERTEHFLCIFLFEHWTWSLPCYNIQAYHWLEITRGWWLSFSKKGTH